MKSKLIYIILLFTFLTRIYGLASINKPYFDEHYHLQTVKMILVNDSRLYDWTNQPQDEKGNYADWLHPPLVKYFQALLIGLLGDNAFGWRIPSVVFGTLAIYLTYLLGKELFNTNIGLTAALITSLDGLIFVQSRIAMNDIFLTVFSLQALLFFFRYLKKSNTKLLFQLSFFLGLALAVKWSALFLIFGVLTSLVFRRLKVKDIGNLIKESVIILIFLILIYCLSFWQLFFQGKDFGYVWQLHLKIMEFQTDVKLVHENSSKPINWLFNAGPITYYHNFVTGEKIINFGNPILHYIGIAFIFLSTLVMTLSFMDNKFKLSNRSEILSFLISKNSKWLNYLLVFYYLLWLPWIFSPRPMFYYHYTSAVPLLCLISAYWLHDDNVNYYLRYFLIALVIISFAYFYPVWNGIV